MAADFDYKPLRESGEVRLIKVLPDLDHGHISLTLSHEDLPAEYRCLSYEWREDTATHIILLNGRPFKVRPNLHDFLRRARETWPNENIWIDAICINQLDVIERGKQVQQMGKIYSGATEVLMWLGADPATDLAVSMFSMCHFADHEATVHGETNIEVLEQCLRNDPDVFIDAIKAFALNSYAERAWVTQEVLLAKQPLLVTTSAVLTLKCLRDVSIHDEQQLRLLRTVKGCDLFGLAFWWFGGQDNPTSAYRQDFPSNFPAKRCTLACDHVYSLLGLVKEGSKFPVNYNEDITTLFWRTVEFFTTPPFEVGESSWFLGDLMRLLCVNADDLMVNNVGGSSMFRYRGFLAPDDPRTCHSLNSELERTNKATHKCHSPTDDQHEPPCHLTVCAVRHSLDTHAHLVFEVSTEETYRLSYLIDNDGRQVLVPQPSGSAEAPRDFQLLYGVPNSDDFKVLTTSAFMTLSSIEKGNEHVRIAVYLPRESVLRTLTREPRPTTFQRSLYNEFGQSPESRIECGLRARYKSLLVIAHT